MKTRGLLVVLVVLLAAVAVAAGRPSAASFEYRFIQTGSWSTNAAGEKIGYLEGAEEVCARMSAKGWDLVSSTALSELNGPVLVLGFARLKD